MSNSTNETDGIYPNPLPSSGPISMSQIADWMLAAGEITQEERNGPLSLATLHSKSHLPNAGNPPMAMSHWYGYSK